MDYGDGIAVRSPAEGRPVHYEDLLFAPVGATPADSTSYSGWEFDHAESLRFYVGGFRWFMRATGIFDLSKISDFALDGVAIAKQTKWIELPVPEGDWNGCSINQFRAAKDIKAVQFAKAALVIATCEAIVQKGLESGRLDADRLNVGAVYQHMSIVPAVWSLAQIAKGAFDKVDPKHIEAALDSAGQTNPKVLEDLSLGSTVTQGTAVKLKAHIDGHLKGISTGAVTSRRMNARNASPNELLTPEPNLTKR
jgi:hypothetical protein